MNKSWGRASHVMISICFDVFVQIFLIDIHRASEFNEPNERKIRKLNKTLVSTSHFKAGVFLINVYNHLYKSLDLSFIFALGLQILFPFSRLKHIFCPKVIAICLTQSKQIILFVYLHGLSCFAYFPFAIIFVSLTFLFIHIFLLLLLSVIFPYCYFLCSFLYKKKLRFVQRSSWYLASNKVQLYS